MSFSEYIFNLIVGEDEHSIKNERDYKTLLQQARTIPQYRLACEYFVTNQQKEEVTEAFFQSKILSRIVEQTIKYSQMISVDTTELSMDNRAVELLRLLIHVVNSMDNELILNQLLSGMILERLMATIYPISCRLSEYILLMKVIALKLTPENVDLFIHDGNSFELYRIACSLPFDMDNYHLKIAQKSIVLLIAKCLERKYQESFKHLSHGFLVSFIEESLKQWLNNFDSLIDDLMFINDYLSVSPLLVGEYYQLISKLDDSILLSFSFNLVHYYDESVKEIVLNFPLISCFDLFLWVSICKSLVNNCSSHSILSALSLLPSHLLFKSTIISNLLTSPPLPPRPSSSSRKTSAPQSPIIPSRMVIHDLGPLDPSSVQEESTDHCSKSIAIDIPNISTRPPIMISASYEPSSTVKSHVKKRTSDYDVHLDGSVLYQDETVVRLLKFIMSLTKLKLSIELKQVLIFSLISLINDLLSIGSDGKCLQLLKQSHRDIIEPLIMSHVHSPIINNCKLLNEYKQLSFPDFMARYIKELTVMKDVVLAGGDDTQDDVEIVDFIIAYIQ